MLGNVFDLYNKLRSTLSLVYSKIVSLVPSKKAAYTI